MANRLTGKAGVLTVSSNTIAFKVVTASVTRDLADTTDSSDYDAASDMLWQSQIPVKLGTELKVEGNYNLSTTPSAILATLYSGATAVPVTLKQNATTTLGHGNFDLSDFEAKHPVDDTVTFTATLRSNGVWTNGS